MFRPLTVQQPTELLVFLFASLPKVGKSKVRQGLKFGAILVNGQGTTQFDQALRPGDVVSMRSEQDRHTRNSLPTAMVILFEDDHLIVIHKPKKLLSMASETEREKTAYSYLTDYVRGGNERSRARIFIVHRLDRETSGLMVFARTVEAKERLQANWDQGEKRYLAIVEGGPQADRGVLESDLDEASPFKVYSVPASHLTRHATTHYEVLRRTAHLTLLELRLATGRRHQIRVQLAEIGCPIIGDEKYSARTDPAKRLGLHACRLKFRHPITGEELQFESPLPTELARLL
ncbi:MAG: hypothetical protein RL514_3211 [Verrucomicrobiota bacterium]|jgi:23S rRNA pseudouridine1911/1915/1917 synthase